MNEKKEKKNFFYFLFIYFFFKKKIKLIIIKYIYIYIPTRTFCKMILKNQKTWLLYIYKAFKSLTKVVFLFILDKFFFKLIRGWRGTYSTYERKKTSPKKSKVKYLGTTDGVPRLPVQKRAEAKKNMGGYIVVTFFSGWSTCLHIYSTKFENHAFL